MESKKYKNYQPTLFETSSAWYDVDKTRIKGKIFELTRDTNGNGRIDIDDLEWHYLDGDGDFRSKEVCQLRDEADIIVTNPPFSLFREFLNWIVEANKQFLIIGNQNAITYKEIFPLIKENKVWLGKGFKGGAAHFISTYQDYATAGDHREGMIRVSGVVWFTNIDHGRRHEPMQLMSMKDNLRFGRHVQLRENGYLRYENYDAIEVPFSDSIPNDYEGAMGVPITFLDKYCPEQFKILGMCENLDLYGLKTKVYTSEECKTAYLKKFGKPGTYDLNASGVVKKKDGHLEKVYQRILIQKI